MDKLKNLWKEIAYQADDFIRWLNWNCSYQRRHRTRRIITEILMYLALGMLVVILAAEIL